MNASILNTGPSPHGWHGYEMFRRCARLFQLKANMVKHDDDGGGKATGQGTAIHLALAHWYGRSLAKYKHLCSPIEALAVKCGSMPDLQEKLEGTIVKYMDAYADDFRFFRVIDVECEYATTFDGAPFTARIDLVVEDKDGLVYFVDHKSTSKLNARTKKRYEMSGQLLGQYILGQRKYKGQFGGVMLNHIQTDGKKFEREMWIHRPQHYEVFQALIKETWDRMQAAKKSGIYTPSLSEQVCFTPYGPCDLYDVCYWRGGAFVSEGKRCRLSKKTAEQLRALYAADARDCSRYIRRK